MPKKRMQRPSKSRTGSPDVPSLSPETQLITNDVDLVKVCDQVRECKYLAFDTEFVMEERFQAEVCLVQIATASLVAVVDPQAVSDLGPVWSLVADPEIVVVVHAGMEDLALCQMQGGVTPCNVFDCQVAYGLVSGDYPLSLSRMVKAIVGVRLHKSQTLTDWASRPLSKEQIRYAADDVAYLPEVHRVLGARLRKLGRGGWMSEEMARFESSKTYMPGVDKKVFRLKGAGALDRLGLAIARELVGVREELALRYNRPVRAVIRDHLIIEIAKHRWSDVEAIKKLRGLSLRSDAIAELAKATARACVSPEDSWPEPAPVDDETDQEAAIAMLAGAVIRSYCAEHSISHQLVGSKKDVRAYVRSQVRESCRGARSALCEGWRGASVGSVLQDVVHGQSLVGMKRSGRGFRVYIE